MIKCFEVPGKIADHIENFMFSNHSSWTLHSDTISKEHQEKFAKEFKFTDTIANFKIKETYWFQIVPLQSNNEGGLVVNNEVVLRYIKPLQDYIALEVVRTPVSLRRIYINMFLYCSTKNAIAYPHVDAFNDDEVLSCLYYVNNSTGHSVFFDNDKNVIKKVKPKKGTGVIFNSNILHAGCYPNKENEPRVVVNFLFKNI